jgi:hypothetical protein
MEMLSQTTSAFAMIMLAYRSLSDGNVEPPSVFTHDSGKKCNDDPDHFSLSAEVNCHRPPRLSLLLKTHIADMMK